MKTSSSLKICHLSYWYPILVVNVESFPFINFFPLAPTPSSSEIFANSIDATIKLMIFKNIYFNN